MRGIIAATLLVICATAIPSSSASGVRDKRGLVPGTGWQSYNTPQPTSQPYTDKYQSYYNTPAPVYNYYPPRTTQAPRWSNGGQGWGYGSSYSSYSGNSGSPYNGNSGSSYSGNTGGSYRSYNPPSSSSYGGSPSYSSGSSYSGGGGGGSYSSGGSSGSQADYVYNYEPYYDDDIDIYQDLLYWGEDPGQYSLIGRDGRRLENTNSNPEIKYSIIGRDGRKPEVKNTEVEYSLIGRDGKPRPNKPLKSICQQNEIEKYQRYAFYKNDSKCYEIGTKGPCKSNMRFYLEDSGSEYGDCDCDANVGYTCGRPLIYYQKRDWCFPVYSRGPCDSNYWLVLDIKGQATCDYNPCMDQQRKSQKKDSDCEHWVSERGRCYETSSQAYCLYTEELKWNIYDSRASGPQCTALKSPDESGGGGSGWGGGGGGGGSSWSSSSDLRKKVQINKSLPCLPGMKQTQQQRCTPNKLSPQTRTW